MENKIAGSCYCGNIQFKLNNKPKLIVNCHCDDCKKRNGSAFSTYIAVSEKEFQIIKGENTLKQYEAKNIGIKYFCSECGSPVYNKNFRFPELSLIFYGALAKPAGFEPNVNIYCSTKHTWVDDISNIQSFQDSIER